MLGLTTGLIGARAFRQTLSDTKKLAANQVDLLLEAMANVQRSADQHVAYLASLDNLVIA
jgi:tRNA-dihydrouridine synthase A